MSPLFRHPVPTAGGVAVNIGDGIPRLNSLNFPVGEFNTPFWFRTDGGEWNRVNVLPFRTTRVCGTIQVTELDPVVRTTSLFAVTGASGRVLATQAGGTPELVLEANFNNGTGNTIAAVGCGGLFDTHFCATEPPGDMNEVITIVPNSTLNSLGGSLGWSKTPNVARVRRYMPRCWQAECRELITQNAPWWGRAYWYVDDQDTVMNHPNVVGVNAGPFTWLGFDFLDSTSYRPHIQLADWPHGFASGGNYVPPEQFDRWHWYRVEWMVSLHGTHADGHRLVRITGFVYDFDSTTPMYSFEDFERVDGGGATLGDDYDGGLFIHVEDNAEHGTALERIARLGFGYESNAGPDVSHGDHYMAAIAASVEDWIGPGIPNPNG